MGLDADEGGTNKLSQLTNSTKVKYKCKNYEILDYLSIKCTVLPYRFI